MRRPTREKRLTDLLKANGHVVTLRRGLEAGFTPGELHHYVQLGRLYRIRRGVLADAGVARTPEIELRAALAEAGAGAVASHRSAAGLWRLIPHLPAVPQITVPASRRMRTPGVVVHRSSLTVERTIDRRTHLRATTASRTLLDLAGDPSITPAALHSMVDEAVGRNLTAIPKLVDMVRTWPGRRCPGGPRLLAALDSGGFLAGPEASALERHMALLLRPVCEAAGVDAPVVEHAVDGGRFRLDFAWPDLRIAVEVDGYLWHHSRDALDRDTARRIELEARGWRVMVFTWHQVVHEPDWVSGQILDRLRRAA